MKKLIFILFLFIATSCHSQQNFYWSHSGFGGYGYLYNWYAAAGVGDTAIFNTGWTLPTGLEYYTLMRYLDADGTRGSNDAGGYLKETGFIHWYTPNTDASNNTRFNGRGAGVRSNTGVFSTLTLTKNLWTSSAFDTPTEKSITQLSYNTSRFVVPQVGSGTSTLNINGGASVRLIKTTTTLTDGQRGTYTGNDGTVYPTICIGTQEWLARNLYETKYSNGDLIPVVTDNTAWAALVTGARCVYNNEEKYK